MWWLTNYNGLLNYAFRKQWWLTKFKEVNNWSGWGLNNGLALTHEKVFTHNCFI